jgi:hypothetical protein
MPSRCALHLECRHQASQVSPIPIQAAIAIGLMQAQHPYQTVTIGSRAKNGMIEYLSITGRTP